MPNLAPKPVFVIIEWYDPSESGDTWVEHKLGDVKGEAVATIGFLLEETADAIIMAYNYAADGEVLRRAFIPKTHIRRMKRYKYPWKGIGSKVRVPRPKGASID